MKHSRRMDLPNTETLKSELKREMHRKRFGQTLRSTVYTLIVVAAVAILLATLLMPVYRVYGTSMTPTLGEGEVVVALKSSKFTLGDVVALWYNNKLLVKRVIAGPGQWVDIDADGNVYVDGQLLDEPYVTDKAFGDCNLSLPYQVADGRFFVMGDHRSTSQDSRNTAVGCIAEEQIVGRIVFRIWPFDHIGTMAFNEVAHES